MYLHIHLYIYLHVHLDSELVHDVLLNDFGASAKRANGRLPHPSALPDALYVLQMGGIDFRTDFSNDSYPVDYINSTIVPLFIAEIRSALEVKRKNLRSAMIMDRDFV
jgi:hypothetical protein